MLGRIFRRESRGKAIAASLYGAIVAQARAPALYSALAVPDTVAGRFEMVVLHVALVHRRLRDEAKEARAVGQGVFDLFCVDMDRSLREMGVGDLIVPKRMKKMAEVFYGRYAAYDAGLAADSADVLAVALDRMIFDGKGAAPAAILAGYVTGVVAILAATTLDALFAASVAWPDPETHASLRAVA
jgi:cytochrome b pre-mRNA-processing protein 3